MTFTEIQRRLARYLLVTAIVVGVGACGLEREGDFVRLGGAIPAERLMFSDQSMDEVFRWRFGAGANLGAWTVRADVRAEPDGEFLRLEGSEHSQLIRDVNFPARDVDVIRARLDGLRTGRTRVFWARDNEQFSADREVMLGSSDGVDGVFEFRVGEHPEWSGQIRRFRFDATTTGEAVSLASIVATRARAKTTDDSYGQQRGIELDNELRGGFVVTPRQPRTHRVSLDGATRLYFATALLLPPRAGPARLTVTRVGGDAEEEVFSRSIASPGPSSRRWTPNMVEMDGSGGGDSELRFALECPETDECGAAFASLETRQGGRSERPNVVLISIDTLRADRMSLYANPRPTTPQIDAWAAASGITFERMVAATPWTLPSHTSMLTGLDATTHDVNHNTTMPQTLELLSERLHAAGYFTAAVTGGGYVDAGFGYWQGFDTYTHWRRDVSAYRRNQTASAEELPEGLQRALSRVDEAGGRPFFLLFHTYEVHAPFHAQQPYFEQFYGGPPPHPDMSVATQVTSSVQDGDYKLVRSLYATVPGAGTSLMPDDDLPLLRALYDSGVAYTDARIGDLLDGLEARGLLENTIIVLTSDHGEMLGEVGLGSHAYLHEPNLLIPLVVSWPARLEGGRRVDAQVRTVDIVPTVLELLGHEVPDGLDGVSLVAQLEGRPVRQKLEALTYAASSGYGVSLRFDNDLKYIYENSLFRPGLVDRLAPVDPDIGAASMDFSKRAEELRLRVEQVLEGRKGVHMLLVNDEGDGGFEVFMRGPAVNLWTLKATRLTCDCASWLGGAAAELRVPSGKGFAVQFEDASAGSLALEVRAGDASFSTEIDLGDLDEPVALTQSADGWSQTTLEGTEIRRGLLIWRQGPMTYGVEGPVDEDLQRQLRALGYLR